MPPHLFQHRRGSMIIEVLLSLSIVVVLAVVVGNTLSAVHRLEQGSALAAKAVGYAREYLEVMDSAKNQVFVPTTSGCTPQPGYTKCWAHDPTGFSGTTETTPFSLAVQAGAWQLQAGADTTAHPGYTRTLTVKDLGDTNIKQVTVTVSWVDRGNTKQVQLANVLTAWNVP